MNRCLMLTTVLLSLAANSFGETNIPSCYDEDGNPVDWFIAYKFPTIEKQGFPFNTGYAYAYITSENVKAVDPTAWSAPANTDLNSVVFLNEFRRLLMKYIGFSVQPRKPSKARADGLASGNLQWTISGKKISDEKSIVMRTLAIAYENKKNINSIYYNDGVPKQWRGASSNSARAHAKGAVLIDDITGDGIWLTHSTPQFPPPRSTELKFEPNSRVYGQTFMCNSFDTARSGKQIVDHLINMRPLVYDSLISERLYETLPKLHDLTLEGSRLRRVKRHSQTTLSQVITTKGGQDLYLFSKSPLFGEDIYADWIDDELKTTLYVATWRSGTGSKLNSTCPRDKYHVNNIQDFTLSQGSNQITWSFRQDHSKWAISEDEDVGVVCISDLNRMKSQFKRGGGAVCIKCPSCWSVFSKTILDLEPCPVGIKKSDGRSDAKPSSSDVSLYRMLSEIFLNDKRN